MIALRKFAEKLQIFLIDFALRFQILRDLQHTLCNTVILSNRR